MLGNILITGGAGHIGGSLAAKLIQHGGSVVVVDNLSTGCRSKLPDSNGLVFIEADVNRYDDIAAVMIGNKFDHVFHYAATVGVKRTLDDPLAVLKDIDGIKNVLELAKNSGVRRIFYASSSEVYGEPVSFPQNEQDTPLNSRLPYAVVKNVGEAFVRSYSARYGIDHTIFRFFNTYGPLQSTDFVMSRFIHAALAGQDLAINGDGLQTRTFCYVEDNIDVAIEALRRSAFVNDTVNIGSDVEVTILELAQAVINVTGSRSKVVHRPPLEEGDMTRRQPDITKMRSLLGRPLVELEAGIRETLRQMKLS